MRPDLRIRHHLWELLITASTIFLALDVPARLVLKYHLPGGTLAYWFSTLVLFGDVFVQSRPAVQQWRRAPVHSPQKATLVRVSWLVVDVIAAIPFRLLPGGAALDLLRLVKLTRVI